MKSKTTVSHWLEDVMLIMLALCSSAIINQITYFAIIHIIILFVTHLVLQHQKLRIDEHIEKLECVAAVILVVALGYCDANHISTILITNIFYFMILLNSTERIYRNSGDHKIRVIKFAAFITLIIAGSIIMRQGQVPYYDHFLTLLLVTTSFIRTHYSEPNVKLTKEFYKDVIIITLLLTVLKFFAFKYLTGGAVLFVYLGYNVLCISILSKYREDHNLSNLLFLLISVLGIATLSFCPVHYFDPYIISSIMMLFYLKSNVIYSVDSKFGTVIVFHNKRRNYNLLLLDKKVLAMQALSGPERDLPQLQYGKNSPVKNFFTATKDSGYKNFAIIGAKNGSLASYIGEGQNIAFYDQNEATLEAAKNPEYFSYIANSKATIEYFPGNPRKVIKQQPNVRYDVIIHDSNVPLDNYLLTYEAIKLLLSRLNDNGALLIYIADIPRYVSEISKIATQMEMSAYYGKGILEDIYVKKKQEESSSVERGLVKSMEEHSFFKELFDMLEKKIENISGKLGLKHLNSMMGKHNAWIIITKNDKISEDLVAHYGWRRCEVDQKFANTPLMTDVVVNYDNYK